MPELADPAERFDLALGNLPEHVVELLQRCITFDGIEWRQCGLGENQAFPHGLIPGFEVGEERVAAAQAGRLDSGIVPVRARFRCTDSENRENFLQR